jgi:hypothetical protein
MSRRTLYNWLANAEFQAALVNRRKEMADRVADRVAELGQVAITTIINALQSDESVCYERQAQAQLAERLLIAMGLLAGSAGKRVDVDCD